jgi:hypothetical protein
MRDRDLPLETRVNVAHEALPYIHSKPQESVRRQATPGRYGNAYESASAGWGRRRSIEVKILRGGSAMADVEGSGEITPLSFLLGVMRNAETPPGLRVRVASIVAPYVHPKRPGAGQERIIVEDATGFAVDPAVAMELRDAKHRLESLSRSRITRPAEYKQETPDLEARIAAIERTLECPCPSQYGVEQVEADRERLKQLSGTRHSGLKLTKEEDIEEAHLTARVAAYSSGPEEEIRLRIFHLQRRQDSPSEPLAVKEQNDLRVLMALYPKKPIDEYDPWKRKYLRMVGAASWGLAADQISD